MKGARRKIITRLKLFLLLRSFSAGETNARARAKKVQTKEGGPDENPFPGKLLLLSFFLPSFRSSFIIEKDVFVSHRKTISSLHDRRARREHFSLLPRK